MSSYRQQLARVSDIQEHLGLLHGLALGCEQVVELGFRTGVSTSAFLAAGCKVRSYDIDRLGCRPHVRTLAREYPDTFEFKQGDSTEVDIPECDLLFIDTDHTFVTTQKELYRHAPKVNLWIVLHDTETFAYRDRPKSKMAGKDHAGREGVMAAIDEFRSHEPERVWQEWLHLPNCNGLTLLKKWA